MHSNNTLEKWEEKTLGEVCDIGAGNSAPQDVALFEDGKYPFIRTADVGKIHFGKIYSSNDLLNDNGIKGLKLFKKGTILIPKSGASTFLNHRVKMEIDGYVVSHLATVKGNNAIVDDDYLLYYLSTIKVQDLIQDQNYPSVNIPIISGIKILLPNLQEQQRIVGILDEIFENIEKAKQNTLQNLNNAKELFENTLESLFTKNADEWTEKKLSELGKIYTGTTPKTSEKDNFGNFIPFIKPADFNKDGTLNYNNEGLSEKGLKKARFIPKNSVLMVCIGATITKTSYTTVDITCNQQINTLTPNIDNYKFIYYAMIRKAFKDVILSGCPQTTLPIINKTNWSELTIKLPNSQTQQKIVQQLDKLQEQTKKLEQIYTQKLQDLDELKQSLLQKAFNGKL